MPSVTVTVPPLFHPRSSCSLEPGYPSTPTVQCTAQLSTSYGRFVPASARSRRFSTETPFTYYPEFTSPYLDLWGLRRLNAIRTYALNKASILLLHGPMSRDRF
jgi:hypothetical protein